MVRDDPGAREAIGAQWHPPALPSLTPAECEAAYHASLLAPVVIP
jgi:hypothetical protein